MLTSFARYLSIGALVAGAACSGTTPSNNQAALTGRVDAANQAPAGQTTTVTASFVDGSGGLTAVSSPVQVDASGRYNVQLTSLTATTSADTAQVIVTAHNAANIELGSAVVEGKFTTGSTFKVAPINASSSAEAKLLVNAKASGQWGSDFTLGELRALVGAQTAITADADAKAAASVSVAAIAGWRSMLSAQSFTNLKAALAANASAEATLDAQLDVATTADQIQMAHDTYTKAFITAFVNAGATVDQIGYATTATADVVNASATSLSASIQSQVLARAASLQADRVTASVEANLTLAGASAGSMQVATAAGVTLKQSIATSAQAGASAKAQIKQAWMQYRTAIDTIAAATITPVLATQVATDLEAALTVNLTALGTARAALSGTANVMASADSSAIMAFISSNLALKTNLTAAGVSDVQANALISVMTQVDAAAGN